MLVVLQELLKNMDLDNSGTVELDEYCAFVESLVSFVNTKR